MTIVKKLSFLGFGILLVLNACTPQASSPAVSPGPQTVESFPISTGELKNCRFQNPTPTYSVGANIPPNPIVCDQGVATAVQLLSTTPLPTGLSFSMGQLSLVGASSQKMASTAFQYYIENSSNYLILNLQITVQ